MHQVFPVLTDIQFIFVIAVTVSDSFHEFLPSSSRLHRLYASNTKLKHSNAVTETIKIIRKLLHGYKCQNLV